MQLDIWEAADNTNTMYVSDTVLKTDIYPLNILQQLWETALLLFAFMHREPETPKSLCKLSNIRELVNSVSMCPEDCCCTGCLRYVCACEMRKRNAEGI